MKFDSSCSCKKRVEKKSAYVVKIVRKLWGSLGKHNGTFE